MFKSKRSLLILVITVINSLTAITFYLYQQNSKDEKEDLLDYAHHIGLEVKQRLIDELNTTTSLADSLCYFLENNYASFPEAIADSNQIYAGLEEIIHKAPHIAGAYIAFHNKHTGKHPKLYSAYIQKKDGIFKYDHLENHYDYTTNKDKSIWYLNPVKENSPTWTGPFLGHSSKKRFITYGIPIQLQDSSVFVLGINYSTTKIYSLLNSWKSSRIGYPYLMTQDGQFLAHPSDEVLSLKEIGLKSQEHLLIDLADAVSNEATINPNGFYHRNTLSGKMCWEQIFHLEEMNWTLGFSITDQQIYSNPFFFNAQRKKHIRMALLFFFALLVIELFLLLLILRRGDTLIQSVVFSICSILFIILFFIYHSCLKYPNIEFSDMDFQNASKLKIQAIDLQKNQNKEDSITFVKNYERWNFSMLVDNDRVNDYVNIYNKYIKLKDNTNLTQIQTGLYVQTIKFLDSYSAKLTGYVWQFYPADKNISKGVVFPDAEDCLLELKDSLSVYLPNGNIANFYRWYFAIEIREPFNYREYPFDRNNLWIRLWTKDFDNDNVILTPDISSYNLFHPSYKPGIDKDIIIPGWNIEASYFSFKEKNYYTNFGDKSLAPKNLYPELHYNIMLKRSYIDPIITRIFPLLVLLLMTYSILYVSKKEDALSVAIACSGLLFVVVFEHINLRKTLDMPGIIYLEYFYFISYLLLMLVAVNASIEKWFSTRPNNRNLSFNFIRKFYWTIALSIVLLVTLYTFY